MDLLPACEMQTNLLDPSMREAGQRRKDAAPSTSGVKDDEPTYRDRAAERRVAFNQPDKPLPEEAPTQPQKRKFAEGPKPPPPPPAPAVEPGKDEANVGNQLLAKMGWKSGTGLGREGEGRVDPVLVQQFDNRAGLGASKGHDASRWQGPGGFQRRALDMVSLRGMEFDKELMRGYRRRRGTIRDQANKASRREESLCSCPCIVISYAGYLSIPRSKRQAVILPFPTSDAIAPLPASLLHRDEVHTPAQHDLLLRSTRHELCTFPCKASAVLQRGSVADPL